jgi:hypothetical protein
MSDNGMNFVGANSELRALYDFLKMQHSSIANFCSSQRIEWSFIPEKSPHFGGLWEASVKSAKSHLKRVTNKINFAYEELVTVLAQSGILRPLTPMLSMDGDGVEPLTPGYFIIGRPLTAIPSGDPPATAIEKMEAMPAVGAFLEKMAH